MTWKRTVSFVLALMMAVSASSTALAAKSDEDTADPTASATLTDEASNSGDEAQRVDDAAASADGEYADFGNNTDEKYKGYGGSQYITYLTFLNYFSNIERVSETITVDADTPLHSSSGAEAKEITDDFNTTKKAYVVDESGYIDAHITAEKAGLYHIAVDYLPIAGKSIDAEISLNIDGCVQYKEVNSLSLNRIWTDDRTPDENGNWPPRDFNDNEVSPETKEVFRWTDYTIHDNSFTSDSDLYFYLSEGEHSIKITVLRESVAFASISIGGTKQIASYKDVYADYQAKGYKPVSDDTNILINAEYPTLKSHQSLMMNAEYTASTTNGCGDMLHYSKTRYNSMGGENWKSVNQWIEYEITAEQDALYTLSFKYKQDYVTGMNVYRSILVDGEFPCEELQAVAFAPTSMWTNYTVADENGNPYYIHLSKGTHTIRLNVTFGPIAETLQILETQVTNLNKWYRKIVQITGPSPDTLRDYDLHKTITGLIDGFKEIRDTLYERARYVETLNSSTGGLTSFIDVLVKQLDGFIEDPVTISAALTGYKSNIAELSDIIVDMKNQSLLLDSIYIGSGKNLPMPKVGFVDSIKFAVNGFISSFTEDYSGYGNVDKETEGYICEPITVWMSGGRDQYNILKAMVADKFVAKYKIPVKLMLGDTGALTKAILAGIAPDCALGIGMDAPVSYSMRGALADLTQFNDKSASYDTTFDEAYQWFHKSAFIAMKYQDGGVYGLPETQGFNVMFYRTDILNDYGIDPPKTWDDVYKILGLLQRNNMQIGLGAGDQGMLATLFFQRGGEWYVEDKSKTNFDSDLFVESFIQWTEFNTKWGTPLSFDALNRFRTGEIPIIFGGFGFVNTLQISAPELAGLWDMDMQPGTLRTDKDGNEYIDYTQSTGGTCCIMTDVKENAEHVWQFMTWWTGADAQAEYGLKLEAVLTTGGRYSPANLEAFERLPWTYSQSQVIKEQWEWLYDQPRVPGDYYIGRQLTNAFRAVVYSGRNPREALLSYNQDANVEIQRKRKEYNVDRFWEDGYVHVDANGNPITSIIDNETYERPTNYFNLKK